MTPLLEIEDLRVRIPTAAGDLQAVRGISFSVKRGETLCIVGESGCGKTLTSLAIMGLLPFNAARSAAKMRFKDEDLLVASSKRLAALRGDRIAMIFQDPMSSLNPVFTIGAQLAEAYLLHRDASRVVAMGRAEEMLQRVGISEPRQRMRQYPHQLSGGLLQRVMIAMALMCEPELLIADEPTTALDVTIQAGILRLLFELKQESQMALVLITHDLGVVASVADRVAVLYAGEVVEVATAREIFERPFHPYTRSLMRCVPSTRTTQVRQRLGTIRGMVPNLVSPPTGCSFSNRCDLAQERCTVDAMPMRVEGVERLYRCLPVAERVGEARA